MYGGPEEGYFYLQAFGGTSAFIEQYAGFLHTINAFLCLDSDKIAIVRICYAVVIVVGLKLKLILVLTLFLL